jgi:hypothetical protein
MKMAEILRSLADKIDKIEQGDSPERPANTGPTADHFQHDVEGGADTANGNVELSMNPVMVPPLQAKLELLKKATAIDNVYDDKSSNELGDIKKLTGIKAVIQHEASEDNDIVG